MTQKNAQVIFIIFNVIAVFAVIYVIYDFVSVNSAFHNREKIIPFDTGTYYLLLMSVFWLFSFIQYSGLKKKESKVLNYANQLAIIWFVSMLLLANLIPVYLVNKFESGGYTKCTDTREISRISKGESIIYRKDGCK